LRQVKLSKSGGLEQELAWLINKGKYYRFFFPLDFEYLNFGFFLLKFAFL
jgi:hypothetical protein